MISEREGREGAGLVRAKLPLSMHTDLTKKKIKVVVKKRQFLKTNKKIKRCITSAIHLSWLALT